MKVSLSKELESICDALSNAQVRFAFSGGLALGASGDFYALQGIELLVATSSANAVYAATAALGYVWDSPTAARKQIDDESATVHIVFAADDAHCWSNCWVLTWRGRVVEALAPDDARSVAMPRLMDRDMSSDAITRRLRLVSQWRNLGLDIVPRPFL